MPAWLAPLAIGAGEGLLSSIFGSDNKYTMSDEQKRALQYIWGELQKPDSQLGFSPQERADLINQIKTKVGEQTQSSIGSNTASLARRGMATPGGITGMTTDITAQGGKDIASGITNVGLASEQAGRQRKSQLLGMLPGMSQGDYQPADNSFMNAMSGFGQNLAYTMNQPKQDNSIWGSAPGYTSPGFGNLRNSGGGGWIKDPYTGQWRRA
jgi:hypothetical protein